MPAAKINVPITAQQQITCLSCHASVAYTTLPNVTPHLYCTQCNNAYHQLNGSRDHKGIFWQRLAHRHMHTIHSHAPVCECGGLFLFNAAPRCPRCKKHLPFTMPKDSKGRLRFSDLVLFDASKLYLDNGTYRIYEFDHEQTGA